MKRQLINGCERCISLLVRHLLGLVLADKRDIKSPKFPAKKGSFVKRDIKRFQKSHLIDKRDISAD